MDTAFNGRKLVIIGGGSSYTPELFEKILDRNNKLRFSNITLVDIQEGLEHAKVILDLGKRMFKKRGDKCQLELTTNRRKALNEADFVISQVRVGGF